MALLNKEMATKNTIKILEKELADDNFLLTLFRDLINGLKGELGNYKQQRNELINDIAKLRERNVALERKLNEYKENEKMTNQLDQLVNAVEQWSVDKGLHNGNSFTQFAKSSEEMGEVAAALCRDNTDALRDGIGDVVVTLVILAQQNNMTLQECLEQAYGEIKDRTGVMSKDGSFIKSEDIE